LAGLALASFPSFFSNRTLASSHSRHLDSISRKKGPAKGPFSRNQNSASAILLVAVLLSGLAALIRFLLAALSALLAALLALLLPRLLAGTLLILTFLLLLTLLARLLARLVVLVHAFLLDGGVSQPIA
jgi:hypothetical protein